jgi:hypothetical protein
MKKLLFIALVAIVFIGCKTDEPNRFEIDPTVTVNIKGKSNSKQNASYQKVIKSGMSNLDVVKKTDMMRLTSSDGKLLERGFADEQRDTISATPMLKMWGTDILQYEELIDGTQTGDVLLITDFLEAKNCIFIDIKGDTIAYIPNSVLRSAESQIKALFDAKNYEPIYELFNNAYTFIPITGEEYRALNQ